MNQIPITIFFYLSVSVVVILALCIIYLLYSYRKLLTEYSNLSVKEDRSEVRKKIQASADRFVSQKIDDAINSSLEEAVNLISKNADQVTKSMKNKALEKLMLEEKGEEEAVKSEFEEARLEIEKYKAQKIEEVRQKANQILTEVAENSLSKSLTEQDKENLILKALENAKQSNIF